MQSMGRNLSYLSQSDSNYKVRTGSGQVLIVHKLRSPQTSQSLVLNQQFHEKLLKVAAIGLPLDGILAIILAPYVIWENINLIQKSNLNRDELIHSKNLIIISIILLSFGVILFSLFVIHLIF